MGNAVTGQISEHFRLFRPRDKDQEYDVGTYRTREKTPTLPSLFFPSKAGGGRICPTAHSLLALICCSSVALREATPHCREGFLSFLCSDWEALLTFLGVRFRVDEHPEIDSPTQERKPFMVYEFESPSTMVYICSCCGQVICMFKCKQVTSDSLT